VKVDLERIDALVENIGELVIVESMVAHAPEIMKLTGQPRIRNYLGQLAKITRQLQEIGIRMRMVPLRGLFQKMSRMVRDLARKSGKGIDVEVSGTGTEMDRSMVEQLADPLVHLIRNSVDHGVEPPEARRAAGKSPTGKIRLDARYEGSSVVVEISDDGRGLDCEAIVAKAVRQGLIKDGENLAESAIYELIFAPSFSTAKQVTEISGRGVGMDVVRRNVESLRGRIHVSSRPGEGTTLSLILPLTLAIIDGTLIACGDERYIFPTTSIIESLRPSREMLSQIAGRSEILRFRDSIYPLLRLGEMLALPGYERDLEQGLVVLVESRERRVAVLVDDVLTQQQIVIKSLGGALREVSYFAGAAILSDGQVGLILDPDELVTLAQNSRGRASRNNGVQPRSSASEQPQL
jgi:two-component system chemotaxis sensor kinase CheA